MPIILELDTDEDFIFLMQVQQGRQCKSCKARTTQHYCRTCREKIRASYELTY